jgi:hypothetical protein
LVTQIPAAGRSTHPSGVRSVRLATARSDRTVLR